MLNSLFLECIASVYQLIEKKYIYIGKYQSYERAQLGFYRVLEKNDGLETYMVEAQKILHMDCLGQRSKEGMEDVFYIISLIRVPLNEMRKFSIEQIIQTYILKKTLKREQLARTKNFLEGIMALGSLGMQGNLGVKSQSGEDTFLLFYVH